MPPTSGTNTPTQAIRVAMGPALISSFRLVPRPVVNMSITTPISAKVEMESLVCTRLSTHGPMSRPARISPTTWGALHLRATRPQNFALRIMIARSRKTEVTMHPSFTLTIYFLFLCCFRERGYPSQKNPLSQVLAVRPLRLALLVSDDGEGEDADP